MELNWLYVLAAIPGHSVRSVKKDHIWEKHLTTIVGHLFFPIDYHHMETIYKETAD